MEHVAVCVVECVAITLAPATRALSDVLAATGVERSQSGEQCCTRYADSVHGV